MNRRSKKQMLATALAHSFLAGDPDLNSILAHSEAALGRRWPWLRATARRYLRIFTAHPKPRHREVVAFLLADRSFRFACAKFASDLVVRDPLVSPQRMQPRGAFASLALPPLHSMAMLASWLRLDMSELEWFADLKSLNARSAEPRLRHYQHIVLAKPFGGVRLIEAPKVRLKHLQRQILTGILGAIPPHRAAHGFLRNRSIRSYVTQHIGRPVVLRMDLSNFFPSIRRSRVQALFRTIGYPERVADLLGSLCTTTTPGDVWRIGGDIDPDELRSARALYRQSHLPQGAPTSPAIANLCCWRLDQRISALAASAGAAYTRYADDLAFSGDEALAQQSMRVAQHVATIAMEEGFQVHHRKTRLMRQGVRQHLAGIVVNQCSNIPRRDFDLLKATLTNCVRFGAESQNHARHADFRAQLNGRIAFVESIHPKRGQRLRILFNRIHWPV